MPILAVKNLRVVFHSRRTTYRAVNDLSFQIRAGEVLGIVGESGSGKTVICHSLLGLLPPTARIETGRAIFDGVDLLHASKRQLADIRGRRISMIFQDPATSLNPYMRIEDQIVEPLWIHSRVTRVEARKRALAALREIGIADVENRLLAYPHELSGGMRQKVMIAMALISSPALLIADEPTTALDVTVQAQIFELIQTLRRERGTAVIFVTHDLGVVSSFCDRVLVMYAGHAMENATANNLFCSPIHPYSHALRKSVPALQPRGEKLYSIRGEPPDGSQPVSGCPFLPRCDYADALCAGPVSMQPISPGHDSACTRVQRRELRLCDDHPAFRDHSREVV